MKQDGKESNLVSLSVRVPRDLAVRFKVVADSEYRPVAAELRRMIQERVDLAEAA